MSGPGPVQVRFLPEDLLVEAPWGTPLQAIADAAGADITFGCRSGSCGTCRVRKRSGTVEMNHQGGIEEEEIAAGEILACCSYARSPLVLELI